MTGTGRILLVLWLIEGVALVANYVIVSGFVHTGQNPAWYIVVGYAIMLGLVALIVASTVVGVRSSRRAKLHH